MQSPENFKNLDKQVLYNRILKAEKSYPEGCSQREKIAEQKRDLIVRFPGIEKENNHG
jgi:hypothetical protein